MPEYKRPAPHNLIVPAKTGEVTQWVKQSLL
jgi:hypothetical protein